MSAQANSHSPAGQNALAIFQPGDRCAGGRYVIRALISCGGFAEVYEAHDEQTGGIRALKVLQARHNENDLAKGRMLQEAKMGIALNHPNLVRVYDAGVDDGTSMMYFSMERLEGKTLLELLSFHGKIPLVTTLDWVIEVADAVHVLNEIGIVHRDLKLENIFVTLQGVIKVLDLGNMRYERSGMKTTQGPVTGTALYMSPEHIRGDKVDRRADVYALAMIFYELVAGVHPLLLGVDTPPTMMEITSWQLNKTIAPMTQVVPDISLALSRIIEQGLVKDRKQRHPTAAVFSNMLRGVQQALDKTADPTQRVQNSLLKSSLVVAPSERAAKIAAGIDVSGDRAAVAQSGPVRRAAPLGLPTEEQPTELAPAFAPAAPDLTGKGTQLMMPSTPQSRAVPPREVAATELTGAPGTVTSDPASGTEQLHPDQQAAAAFAMAYGGNIPTGPHPLVTGPLPLASVPGATAPAPKTPPMWLGVVVGFVAAVLLVGGLVLYRGGSDARDGDSKTVDPSSREPDLADLTPPEAVPSTVTGTTPEAPPPAPNTVVSSQTVPAASLTSPSPPPPAAPPTPTAAPPPAAMAPPKSQNPSSPPPPPKAPGRLF